MKKLKLFLFLTVMYWGVLLLLVFVGLGALLSAIWLPGRKEGVTTLDMALLVVPVFLAFLGILCAILYRTYRKLDKSGLLD